MIVKARATRDEDKLERRREILDAAERLFREQPESLASMDQLAEAAGVAKGTLYLYFPSKEEVLVALHERHSCEFFDALAVLLRAPAPVTVETLLDLTRVQFLERPTVLSLASLVIGLTERTVPPEAALRFKMKLGEHLIAAGQGLEARLGLTAGDGTRLLNISYALIIGMWQLTGCMGTARYQHLLAPKIARAFVTEYPAETMTALRLIWNGALGATNAKKRAS